MYGDNVMGPSSFATTLKDDLDKFYEGLDEFSGNPRQHTGIFEGSAVSGVIVTADKEFDWDNLQASSGEVWSSSFKVLNLHMAAQAACCHQYYLCASLRNHCATGLERPRHTFMSVIIDDAWHHVTAWAHWVY